MKRVESNLIERLIDGELSPGRAIQVQEQIETSPDSRREMDENLKIRDFLRLMDAERSEGVAFDSLSERVLKQIASSERPLPLRERMSVWLREFFAHRRSVWVPAAAVGALGLTLLLLPAGMRSVDAPFPSENQGIALHSAAPSAASDGSRIAAVDFGDAAGETYSIKSQSGAAIGVVWIVETP